MNRLSRIMSIIAALWMIVAAFARIAINITRHYALDPLPFASIILGIVLIITVLPNRKASRSE